MSAPLPSLQASPPHHIELTDLRGADVSNQRVGGETLRHVDMTDGSLRCATLENADLSGSIFWNTDLCGTDLRTATLTNAMFNGARYDGTTRFPTGFRPGKAGMRREF